ncbi:single-stranded DNA-binding protein [Frankia sp. R43]|uniref:single-stranded DNA-binding protein n=1 Tax=Frankia sp. R43 TaxID=269536 RepID=UPI0006C9F316|nr:single-stranded DNA-binding protein [Frankia sp. R43]KPM50235.1 single-stranded DNA-binding protein [Frankia sp. R43]
MQEAVITIAGNLANDPELRFTPNGAAVASFVIACTERRRDPNTGEWSDGATSYHRCTAWRQTAENAAASLNKGDRVLVVGTLRQSSWADKQSGETRYGWDVQVDEVAVSVKFHAARSLRPERSGAADSTSATTPGRGTAVPAYQS